ncbi:hypothetical protein RJG79_12570 [Mycoplasmatota bacterium WC44]
MVLGIDSMLYAWLCLIKINSVTDILTFTIFITGFLVVIDKSWFSNLTNQTTI